MVDEESEIRLHPLVVLLGLSICLWVVSRRDVLLDGEEATQLLCEFGHEPRVSITYDLGW
jgi:hypothetical protein